MVFHKPSILGYPYFRKHPYIWQSASWIFFGYCSIALFRLHPRKRTWIPKVAMFERRYIFQGPSFFGIYVRFLGGSVFVYMWSYTVGTFSFPNHLKMYYHSERMVEQVWSLTHSKKASWKARKLQKNCFFLFQYVTLGWKTSISRWWQLNFFSFSSRKLGKMNPFWRAYFSNGLKPPTRFSWMGIFCFFSLGYLKPLTFFSLSKFTASPFDDCNILWIPNESCICNRTYV